MPFAIAVALVFLRRQVISVNGGGACSINAMEIAIHTAMRRGEILSLTLNDIDLTARVSKLRDTKNGSNRIVPLSNTALLIFANLPQAAIKAFNDPLGHKYYKEKYGLAAYIERFKFQCDSPMKQIT